MSKAQREDERDRLLWRASYTTLKGSYQWLTFKRSDDPAEDEYLLAAEWLADRADETRFYSE